MNSLYSDIAVTVLLLILAIYFYNKFADKLFGADAKVQASTEKPISEDSDYTGAW